MSATLRKKQAARQKRFFQQGRRRIQKRLANTPGPERPVPMMTASNIHYEPASRKAWSALLVPVAPRHRSEHQAERRTLLRMEFATYREAFLRMPCQLVRAGRRLIYRFLSWNPWQGALLRLVERLHACRLC